MDACIVRTPAALRPCVFFIFFIVFCLSSVQCIVTQLDNGNIDSILANNQVVFVNFYADWCRFSQQLKPIYEEASERFKDRPAGLVAWASVDSDRQPLIAQKYNVNKYPTLKLFRNGELVKKEYRGQRSVDALSSFIQKQLDSSVMLFTSRETLANGLDKSKRNVIAYFQTPSGPEHENFQKVASLLREDCVFWVGSGDSLISETREGNKLYFQPAKSNDPIEYTGGLANYEFLKQWLNDKCIPLVREITFENAEELTEEGLPFLILFRLPDDTASEKLFTEQVIREIPDQKTSINCLLADGKKFAHPLHHLGKKEKDLPLIAIDSFRHMYLFPDMKELTVPGKLRQFVLDLHSGKLHREFHHGPDPVNKESEQKMPNNAETQPPPSVFKQLKPSENRYSIVYKDEL